MSDEQFLGELKSYVGFTDEHARVLASLASHLSPAFWPIVDNFYEAILRTPRALSVFTGGLPQIERQKNFLHAWLVGLFGGVYDQAYLELRARIGRTHVRIKLDQRYMFTAMNLVREGLHRAVESSTIPEDERPFANEAIDKICDIELAIMLQTYSEDSATRLRDSERLAALGQLSGFIGHELRNPLAVMETSLHLLKKRLPLSDDNVQRHVRRLSEQLTASGEIIGALLELARDKPVERSSVELRPAIDAVVGSLPMLEGVPLHVHIASDQQNAKLDEKQFRHLLSNLLTNAAQALANTGPEARRIEISATRQDERLLLCVDDAGPGIPEELRHRLFEPLATTRVKGLGLGLALCRRIAEKHGGHIRALKSPLGGARFEVTLPHAFPEVAP